MEWTKLGLENQQTDPVRRKVIEEFGVETAIVLGSVPCEANAFVAVQGSALMP